MIYNFFGFEEVQILPLFLVMTSYDVICNYWAFKLTHFVEHNMSYQPFKFQSCGLSQSNFKEGGGKHPTPGNALPGPTMPVC